MATGTIQTKNKTRRKYITDVGVLVLPMTNAESSATLEEGQEVYIFGNNSVKKRTSGATFCLGEVVVGGEAGAMVSVQVRGKHTLDCVAIGGAFTAGDFVKPNGNINANGLPEYIASNTDDYVSAVVIYGATENGTARLLLLDSSFKRDSYGSVDTLALGATGTQALTIDSPFSKINGVTTQATGNRTINLTIDSAVKPGARILLLTKTAATETTILGTGIEGPTITGEAGKTFSQEFVYDGTAFYPAGSAVKID